MRFFLWSLGAVLFLVCMYLCWVYLTTLIEVRAATRGPLFRCAEHGLLDPSVVITFAGAKYCPICFHSKLTDAEQLRG